MMMAHENADNEWELWQSRTVHTSYNNYEKMQTATEGLPNVTADVNEKLCGGCLQGKLIDVSNDSVVMEETPVDDDVEMSSPKNNSHASDLQQYMNVQQQHILHDIQQGPRHQEHVDNDRTDCDVMVLRPQVTRESRLEF
ncbi:hypothetical protein PsorP6_009480 [Peronosclerospora sorghi]|uniref:Uncharacterized protein n=1 Tax=Peronosclerospora sorghi TaxID=230839 RepID=A0ACC0VYP2_9STRA|nr:hypothetical protein PsorP6_009480 [Peronosclerospora sorghi]